MLPGRPHTPRNRSAILEYRGSTMAVGEKPKSRRAQEAFDLAIQPLALRSEKDQLRVRRALEHDEGLGLRGGFETTTNVFEPLTAGAILVISSNNEQFAAGQVLRALKAAIGQQHKSIYRTRCDEGSLGGR